MANECLFRDSDQIMREIGGVQFELTKLGQGKGSRFGRFVFGCGGHEATMSANSNQGLVAQDINCGACGALVTCRRKLSQK